MKLSLGNYLNNEHIEIRYEHSPTIEDIQILENGIAEHAKLIKNQNPIETFAFFARNEAGLIYGGCNGAMYYGCLYIDQLWVDKKLRHQSIGSQLIQSAERLGQEKGCTFSTINTMDWEALEFYEKRGYEVEYKRKGYKNDSTLFFLIKEL